MIVLRFLFYVLGCVVTLIPQSVLDLLAYVIIQLIKILSPNSYRRASKNIAWIYGIPEHSVFNKNFVAKMFATKIKNAVWTFAELSGAKSLECQNLAELRSCCESLFEKSKCILVLSAHIGSWELCASKMAEFKIAPFYALAKPARYRWITWLAESVRNHAGVSVLWTDRKTLARDMLKVIREKSFLGFVMDQKPKGRQGPVISFLGKETEFVNGPAKMITQGKCSAVSVFVLRESKYRMRFVFKAHRWEEDFANKDEAQITGILVQDIEKIIRTYPEQWTWEYKRWRYQKSIR